MIQAGFFSAFNFIANNKYAQIAVTAGVILLIWLGNNQMQRRRGAHELRAKAERKARKTQTKIEEESREKSAKVAAARQSIPDVRHSDELPSDTSAQLFGNRRNS